MQDYNEKILIIDDMDTNIDLLKFSLEKYNNIFKANDGKTALEIISRELPDVILLDLMMPGMSGFDVINELKKEEKTKDIPVIFLTANNKSDTFIEAFKLGATDYITKPFKKYEINARIETQLNLKKSKEKLKKQNQELIRLHENKEKIINEITVTLLESVKSGLKSSEKLVNSDRLNPKDKEEAQKIYDAAIFQLKFIEDLKNQ